MKLIVGNKHCSTRWLTVVAMIAIPVAARGAATEARCITVSDVGIVGGAEAWTNKKLCKSPGSARYDVIEVAAAVYGAATTQAAFEKAADPKLRAQRAEIETLRAQMRAGRGEQLALLLAQQQFVADLAAKDRAYSEAIQQFRSTVVDIAATPEGIAALAQYNAGDEIGALAILDRLRAANDAARQTQSNIANAAEARRIAGLALDARDKGKGSVARAVRGCNAPRSQRIQGLDRSGWFLRGSREAPKCSACCRACTWTGTIGTRQVRRAKRAW